MHVVRTPHHSFMIRVLTIPQIRPYSLSQPLFPALDKKAGKALVRIGRGKQGWGRTYIRQREEISFY